jgi:hypothetical protein
MVRPSAAAACALLAACTPQASFVVVHVESSAGSVVELAVTATLGATTMQFALPAQPAPQPLAFPQTFSVQLDASARGPFAVTVEGRDGSARAVGHGGAKLDLTAAGRFDLTIDLDGSGGDGGVLDGGVLDGAGPGSDDAGPDLAPTSGCDPGGGNDTCTDPGTLSHCRSDGTGFDLVQCPLGCGAPPAHCKAFDPTGPIAPGDLVDRQLPVTVVDFAATWHSDTGQVEGYRNANADPTKFEFDNAIGFQRIGNIGVFIFGGLVMKDTGVMTFVGPYPVAILSSGSLQLDGVLDARGNGATAGPGGYAGGGPNGAGGGPGAGTVSGAGGGGGYGGAGGPTGGVMSTAGAAYGETLSPLRGGSGGAGGANASGGGGGGAIQLVAVGTISFGGGTATGGVNAGGCGGGGGGASDGGGGAGGTILVESQTGVHLGPKTVLAANGGSGGGATPGVCGGLDGAAAPPGSPGGQGGAAGAINGGAASTGGGGGGGAGRIVLNTPTGLAVIDGGALLSPTLNDGLTRQGLINLQ